ncbi:hypothetical protein [Polyangium sp. 15x6]|uniref:hypothetical protein n=1 Tax=Polyangium sp. 15x6 TaxID=3042687 RepID=UPI00249BA665|nr:hypothetical protein [Polyangium sp. 15x6]MDI3288012.1 hypothetical protein [Polyangium sp. 15x6]
MRIGWSYIEIGSSKPEMYVHPRGRFRRKPMNINHGISLLLLAVAMLGCASDQGRAPGPRALDARRNNLLVHFPHAPDAPPTRWLGLIGAYGTDTTHRWYVFERDQRLWVRDPLGNDVPLTEISDSTFQSPVSSIRGAPAAAG